MRFDPRVGGNHSWWGNPANNRRSAVPRHSEVGDILVNKISQGSRHAKTLNYLRYATISALFFGSHPLYPIPNGNACGELCA